MLDACGQVAVRVVVVVVGLTQVASVGMVLIAKLHACQARTSSLVACSAVSVRETVYNAMRSRVMRCDATLCNSHERREKRRQDGVPPRVV